MREGFDFNNYTHDYLTSETNLFCYLTSSIAVFFSILFVGRVLHEGMMEDVLCY